MRLKRLELQGFKSFLDRTILTFQPGITGVVGPNGCGKSNIVDAIQWVMGEQSAKHLRGDSMTDVIFNGSDTKAATSMAEVSLVLDRNGVALPPQFASFEQAEEISITRRVYRDGASEYLINKTQCRLRDIHELFMDTGVGKRAYSIIEQGQIDRMISVKPEERRGLFEEVAGITKYKAKRKEAEKKLEGTRANLLRLQDIINELEKQIRSLKVQATRARKYKELKGELETVDLYLLGRNLYLHAAEIQVLEARREELVNERSQSDASFGSFEAEITQLDVQRIDQEREHQTLSEKEKNLSLAIQRLENQVTLLEERKKHLQESYDGRLEEQRSLEGQLTTLTQDLENEQAERTQLVNALEELEAALSAVEETIRDQQQAKQTLQSHRSSLEERKNRLSHRVTSLTNQTQHLGQKEADLNEVLSRVEEKVLELNTSLEASRIELEQAEEKIAGASERATQAELESTALHGECQQMSQKLGDLEEGLYKAREDFHSKRSRLQSLQELQENLEGYSTSAREFLLSLGEARVSAVPLAEVLTPEASMEEHLETILGLDMNTILVQTTDEAEKLTRQIAEQGLERVRIVAISELEAHQQATASVAGLEPLSSKVQVQPGYEAAAKWWLGNVCIASDLSQLFELRKQHPGITFLAADGQTVGHSDHSLTSGKIPTRTGVFARRREIEELATQCQTLEAELTQLTSEREGLLQRLQSQEKLHSELKDKLSSIHVESVGYRKEREKVQFQLSRWEREMSSIEADKQRHLNQQADVIAQKAQVASELSETESQLGSMDEEIAESELKITEAVAALEASVAQIGEKKVEGSRLSERSNSLDYKIRKMESDIEDYNSRLESLRDQQQEDEKELAGIDDNVAQVKVQGEESVQEKDAVVVRLSDVKNAFNDTCHRLQVVRESKDELQRRREIIFNEIQGLEIKLAHESSALEQLKGLSQERYQVEPTPLDASVRVEIEKLPLFVESLSMDWASLEDADQRRLLEEHLKLTKEKVGRYGEVNLTAIQEFDEIQKRYEFLTEQKLDLENSIKILEEAILKIEETTKVRFTETFEAVNAKFTEIFPILFNGGKAELTLVYQEGSTDPGVDIMAQPPGKRLQSITLLSGGEKALTAVSLVLAIFARKPSPFCLLDEVDAPLDDANVSRFNTVVKKMAEKTQFIVITHNKKTMEIAEALYGVTMQRNGISKMASVSLQ